MSLSATFFAACPSEEIESISVSEIIEKVSTVCAGVLMTIVSPCCVTVVRPSSTNVLNTNVVSILVLYTCAPAPTFMPTFASPAVLPSESAADPLKVNVLVAVSSVTVTVPVPTMVRVL